MKQLLIAIILTSTSSHSFAAKKVDWSLCEQEIKESCSTAKSDHDKHECIEKLPKEKVSDECREKNEKVESQMKKDGHKH